MGAFATQATPLGPTHPRVQLFHADADLLSGVPSEKRSRLADVVTVPMRSFPAGRLRTKEMSPPVEWGALVIEGFVVVEISVGGQRTTAVVGPGDLLRPWEEPGAALFDRRRWRALTNVKLAILGGEFGQAVRAWPQIASRLTARLNQRAESNIHLASIRRLEVKERIVHMLWHIGHRWGNPRDGHCELPLPMTHELIADIVGASRAKATSAINRLEGRGEITRAAGKRWHLCGEPSPPTEP